MTGLIINAADGSILVDMTMSISQTLGSVETGGSNGSISIPSPPTGKTMFFIVVPLVDMQMEKGKRPGVSLSNNTLSWAYSYSTAGWGFFSANCMIYYGYY